LTIITVANAAISAVSITATSRIRILAVASTAVAARLLSIMAFFHSPHSTGTGRFHQPTKTGVRSSLLLSLKTPSTNSMQPRPIARRPGLPSAAPSDTPIDAINAPPMVKILLTTDIPNPLSPFGLADDAVDDIHVSARVGAGHMSGPSYREP